MGEIIGRKREQDALWSIFRSGEPELVAVYGRRRIGKTYLVRNVFEKHLAFEISGIHHATLSQQLENFSMCFAKATGVKPATPSGWMEAFTLLTDYLTPKIRKTRRVLFFDEFPWLHTSRSGFMQAFEHFWNMWASRQKNLVVVICGSAAAWMIQRVINNKGGLHNRVTKRIRLLPFTLNETEAFLRYKKININRYQVVQLYMAFGGIPHYLKEAAPGESAMEIIDKTCFAPDGILSNEFRNLFYSLFDTAQDHIAIVKALSKKSSGLTRNQIIEACKLNSGGGITQLLEELTESGFIISGVPFGKTVKDSIYRLADEYTLFYLKFVENGKFHGAGAWIKFSQGASWKSWSGMAFESVCIKHVSQIKKALKIEGVHTEMAAWRYRGEDNNQGAQIDLLIDRQDNCINVCEIKFSEEVFTIHKSYAAQLKNKLAVFKKDTKTRKTLFLTMLSTFGVVANEHKVGLVQNEITMDALFEPG